jgi:hypothetical protein
MSNVVDPMVIEHKFVNDLVTTQEFSIGGAVDKCVIDDSEKLKT